MPRRSQDFLRESFNKLTLLGRCNLTEYLTKRTIDVRPFVTRWEMAGKPVKSRDIANCKEKK